MSQVCERLLTALEESGVAYEVITHRRDYTAQETAESTHTPGREFAKTVLVCADLEFAMVVLPAPHEVDLAELALALGAETVRLATEDEIFEIFVDCELGAEPPFGGLYGLPVYLSPVLADDREITFNAGSHEDAIRMAYADYERLVGPRVLAVSF